MEADWLNNLPARDRTSSSHRDELNISSPDSHYHNIFNRTRTNISVYDQNGAWHKWLSITCFKNPSVDQLLFSRQKKYIITGFPSFDPLFPLLISWHNKLSWLLLIFQIHLFAQSIYSRTMRFSIVTVGALIAMASASKLETRKQPDGALCGCYPNCACPAGSTCYCQSHPPAVRPPCYPNCGCEHSAVCIVSLRNTCLAVSFIWLMRSRRLRHDV